MKALPFFFLTAILAGCHSRPSEGDAGRVGAVGPTRWPPQYVLSGGANGKVVGWNADAASWVDASTGTTVHGVDGGGVVVTDGAVSLGVCDGGEAKRYYADGGWRCSAAGGTATVTGNYPISADAGVVSLDHADASSGVLAWTVDGGRYVTTVPVQSLTCATGMTCSKTGAAESVGLSSVPLADLAACTNGQVVGTSSGVQSCVTPASGTVTSVTGTAPVSVSSGTTTPVVSLTPSGTGLVTASNNAANSAALNGTAGQFCLDSSGDVPTFASLSGDLSCSTSTPGQCTVNKINGSSFSLPVSVANGGTGQAMTCASGQVPIAQSSTALQCETVSGDVTTTSSGVHTVTQAQGGTVLFSSSGTPTASVLLGRYTTGSNYGTFWGGAAASAPTTGSTGNFSFITDGSTFTQFNAPGTAAALYFSATTSNQLGVWSANGIQLFSGSSSFGGGVGVIGITNATTNPTTSPSGGGILYQDSGGTGLKSRGTSGDVDVLAPVTSISGTDRALKQFGRGNRCEFTTVGTSAGSCTLTIPNQTTYGSAGTYDLSVQAKCVANTGNGCTIGSGNTAPSSWTYSVYGVGFKLSPSGTAGSFTSAGTAPSVIDYDSALSNTSACAASSSSANTLTITCSPSNGNTPATFEWVVNMTRLDVN